MDRSDLRYEQYVSILKEELLPAMGCTEPIAIAYAAAKASAILGSLPEKMTIEVSGNIVKNVKSVVVPHTGGLRGIKAAAAAGMLSPTPSSTRSPWIPASSATVQRQAVPLRSPQLLTPG